MRSMKDLLSVDAITLQEVSEYVKSDLFKAHCKTAEFPDGLREALLEAAVLSPVQRRFAIAEILQALQDE